MNDMEEVYHFLERSILEQRIEYRRAREPHLSDQVYVLEVVPLDYEAEEGVT